MSPINPKSKKYRSHDLKRGVDFIGVCVIFYCHDGQGNLLLHKRSKNCRDEVGRWDVGGGALEFGEDFEEAAKREILEEYCTVPAQLKFIRTYNAIRKEGSKSHWIAIVYSALLDPDQVSIGDPEKMDEIGWFSEKNLPDPMHSQFEPFLKYIKNEIFPKSR